MIGRTKCFEFPKAAILTVRVAIKSHCAYSDGYTTTSHLHPRFPDDSRNFYGRTKRTEQGALKKAALELIIDIGVGNNGGVVLSEKHSSPSLS